MTTYSLSRAAIPGTYRAQEDRGSATTHDLLDPRARRRVALSRSHEAASDALTHDVPGTKLARSSDPATTSRRAGAEPTGRVSAPGGTAGPSARLRALPQPTAGQLATLDGVDDHLAELEASRQAQLDALPTTARNVVATAHGDIVAWILEQIRGARRRLSEDLYGHCARCGASIGPERVHMQPWQTTCTTCAPPDRTVLSLPSATAT